MAIIVPLDSLIDGAADAYVGTVVNNLRDLAASKMNTVPDNITVRDMDLEEDISNTNEEWLWTVTSANAYNDQLGATFTVPTDKYFAFFGCHVLTNGSGLQKIKWTQGGNTTDIWSLRQLQAYDHPSCITRKPIVATSQTPLQFSIYGTVAQDEEIVFMCYTAEKRGRLITEKSFGG